MTKAIDLHVHTTASDGTYSPSDVVKLAHRAGLLAVAITDHDTVDGVNEAVEASANFDIEVVPGVEISVGDTDDVHIVGLYVNKNEEKFSSLMKNLSAYRIERNKELISKLQKNGIDITYEAVEQQMQSENVGRLHIAQFLQQKGYVSDYRKAFKKYLIPGTHTYVPTKHVSEREGIETILGSGGVPILAHINYLKMPDYMIETKVRKLKEYGLLGVETMYSGYNEKTEKLANRLCEKYGLLKSGGTDFHGARRKGVYLGKGRGNLCVPYEFLVNIKQKLG